MTKHKTNFTTNILAMLLAADDILSPIIDINLWKREALYGKRRSIQRTIYKLHQRGWITLEPQGKVKVAKLTPLGEIETLMRLAIVRHSGKWDGIWRMLLFDIPEENKSDRDTLRRLLKANGYYQLQASVYINPYPLNTEALRYLERTGLNKYIRLAKIHEMDNDSDLRKHFKL